jgi:hypothetical protein
MYMAMSLPLTVLLIFVGVVPAAPVISTGTTTTHLSGGIDCKEDPDIRVCNGHSGVLGKPFCDKYDEDTRKIKFPEITGCYDRTAFPITYCEEFGKVDYEFCRQTPKTDEYNEYFATGGPDESCLFNSSQIKCLPSPITDECPEGFGLNEDSQCFPLHPEECPDGYHSEEDDETGQCYPDAETSRHS